MSLPGSIRYFEYLEIHCSTSLVHMKCFESSQARHFTILFSDLNVEYSLSVAVVLGSEEIVVFLFGPNKVPEN